MAHGMVLFAAQILDCYKIENNLSLIDLIEIWAFVVVFVLFFGVKTRNMLCLH